MSSSRSALARTGWLAVIALGVVAAGAVARHWSRAAARDAQEASIRALRSQPHLLFVSESPGDAFGRAAIVGLDRPDGPRVHLDLHCDRIYAAAGHGLCLVDGRGSLATPLLALLLGADLRPEETLPLAGPPSRARLSRDGRYGATTVFVTGDSYACNFATRTSLIEPSARRVIADLEQFTVQREGERVIARDFNFWGVTFTPEPGHFFATVATGGKTYLVAGDVAARTMRLLRENVECPSLSPDGRQIAFKKAIGGRGHWRLHVLDVATLEDRPVEGETRNIDDQVEWLDDTHVLYGYVDPVGLPEKAANIWVASTTDPAPSRIFVPAALSPAVVRP
jgi:hypothetical protein